MPFEDVVQKVTQNNPDADLQLLQRAYDFASEAHVGQKRISGEPYITHPVSVAYILASLKMEMVVIVAGLLHDTVEDTGVTLEDVANNFGTEAAQLVDGVTKLGRWEYNSKEERQVESLRKMLLAMSRDIRVIIIKLADRLHNMRTLQYQQEHKQREVALETLDIYAPLAHRLGIYRLKWEMEDLAFRYSNPEKYYELSHMVASTREKREETINAIVEIMKEKLQEVNIEAEIQGRPKNLYSIYTKMQKQQVEFNQIYDVMAVRVLVNTVRDCYAVLGTVHTLWVPIPGRFKDYIAMPKSNMYQSLHTTVVSPQGGPLEIQIRTWEMHRTSEYGIAAHWRYKEGGDKEDNLDRKLTWLRQILDWQEDLKDAREFMEGLKIDLFDDVVFVFTPKGDVMEFPAGSTPIDFAYRVHTQVGHNCVGVKINGKIMPLDYELTNGDRVEILISKQSRGPSRDWLNIAKTSQAKTKIRQWFKKEHRDDHVVRGKESLEREIKKCGLEQELIKGEQLREQCKKMNLASLDDLYAAVGNGIVSAASLVNKLREKEFRENKKKFISDGLGELLQLSESHPLSSWGKPTQGIRVSGVDNILIRLAHCCNPVPGDDIVGYITRGRGVSIHREDCANVEPMLDEPERLVEVAWDEDFESPFQVHLEIIGADRAGLLNDIMAVLMELKISANWVTARGRKDNTGLVEIILDLKNKKQLDDIINRISRVENVYSVHRRGQTNTTAQ